MFDAMFILLALLFVKHWYIDFVNQSQEEVDGKGIYGNRAGLRHSFKHGFATFLIFLLFILDPVDAIVIGLIDFVAHYHIDYIKMHYGNRDIKTPAFWAQLGLDQLAHYFCYLFLVWLVI
jgi:hypothetical protein